LFELSLSLLDCFCKSHVLISVTISSIPVSLVVPLLHQYYKNAGVHSASQREMLSSLYSSSQIAGGLIIGALSDLGYLSRRRILFLSFIGSAVSYAMIVAGSLPYLVFSRVCVGLVKQTMTVSTSLLAKCTTEKDRAGEFFNSVIFPTLCFSSFSSDFLLIHSY